MSVLCLVMHVLCVYALKLLSGFFVFLGIFLFGSVFLGTGLAFLVNTGWQLLWPVAPTDFRFKTQALIYYNFKQA